MQKQGQTASYHDDAEADPEHDVDLFLAQEQPADLSEGRGDRDAGGDENVAHLEGNEEQDDGEKIEKEFHG